MKKSIIILLSVFNTLLSYSQIDKNSNGGIGTGGGLKMYYGDFGIFYNYTLSPFNSRLELNVGTGIRQSIVFGVGSRIRIYDNSKKLESYVSINYCYQLKGNLRYENNNSVDYYTTGDLQYLHYYLTGRLLLDKFAALQLNCGYSQNISGSNIIHTSGPNENYNLAKKTLGSGLLIGVDLIVFLKLRK